MRHGGTASSASSSAGAGAASDAEARGGLRDGTQPQLLAAGMASGCGSGALRLRRRCKHPPLPALVPASSGPCSCASPLSPAAPPPFCDPLLARPALRRECACRQERLLTSPSPSPRPVASLDGSALLASPAPASPPSRSAIRLPDTDATSQFCSPAFGSPARRGSSHAKGCQCANAPRQLRCSGPLIAAAVWPSRPLLKCERKGRACLCRTFDCRELCPWPRDALHLAAGVSHCNTAAGGVPPGCRGAQFARAACGISSRPSVRHGSRSCMRSCGLRPAVDAFPIDWDGVVYQCTGAARSHAGIALVSSLTDGRASVAGTCFQLTEPLPGAASSVAPLVLAVQ